MSELPPVKGRRFLKLAGMTASVAGRYAKTRLKEVFQNPETIQKERAKVNRIAGSQIANTLGELKGAVMKAGQMASIATDLLPKEMLESLRLLQKKAPPMSFDIISEQVEKELGDSPKNLFSMFEPNPFASASIGQVHRAKTKDGRDVVCKVQYPGIDDAMKSDLRQLKLTFRSISMIGGIVKIKPKSLNEAFEELSTRLTEELNYLLEADNIRFFQKFHEQHSYIVIPDVISELSSKRVLTLVYEKGDTLENLDLLGYTQEEKNLIGTSLLNFMASEIFELGAIHADPHPGNFAFRKDGTVVIYDFGSVKYFPTHIIKAYHNVIDFGLKEDYKNAEKSLFDLDIRDSDGPPIEASFYKMWRDIYALPFLQNPFFNFKDATIHREAIKHIPDIIKYKKSFKSAPHVLLLNRMTTGHYGNLCALKTQVYVVEIIKSYLENFDSDKLIYQEKDS